MTEIISGLVSTIIPTYNRPEMLREAVASVLGQTYRPIEILISDDGSSDETPRVADELARQHPEITVLRGKHAGPGPTREAGRQAARGEFIQYLDSDDLLRPRKFEIQVTALRENPQCGAAYGYICVHPLGRPALREPFKGSGDTRETLFPWILSDRWWNTDAPLFRRTVTDAVGPWTDLRWSQDWEYDGRVGALGTRLIHCKEFVCDERHHEGLRQTSPADWLTPERLLSRKRFLTLMLGHAERAGVSPESAERKHFSRWVFATARQCAAAGLSREARECMELAERSAGGCADARRGFRMFQSLCAVMGAKRAGGVLRIAERWKKPGALTAEQSFARDLK
jgi:glycosyltransferase involved in cell wall biosynthesis